MSENKIKFNLFEKIKNIKHIELIVIAIFCGILLLIYSTTLAKNNSSENITTTLTTEEYATYLEKKLSNVLGNISGAGKVSVMLTLSCGVEYVYAKNTEEITTTSTVSGTSTTKVTSKDDLIMVNVSGKSTPIVLRENLPQVAGVIIVASGANNITTRLELQKAVKALLKIDESNIEILIGE